MLLTITIPVMAQITTVSQKGPVMEINPCLFGDLQLEAAAVMGMEPRPASFVKRPLEMPVRIPIKTEVPVIPPIRDSEVKADRIMTETALRTNWWFASRR